MTMAATGRRRAARATAAATPLLCLVMSLMLILLPRAALATRATPALEAVDQTPLSTTATASAKDDFDFFFLVR